MNTHPCEQYIKWMSLAQDSALDRTHTHLLHTHIDACASCKSLWEEMTATSRLFRAAPMVEPHAGFVQRFETRLAYHEEQRRRAMIWLMLGIGAVTLTLLALPSLWGVLSVTGQLVLPYPVIAYIQGLLTWTAIVVRALVEAAGVLIRYLCTGPAGPLCLTVIAIAGALVATWTRFWVGRLARQQVPQ